MLLLLPLLLLLLLSLIGRRRWGGAEWICTAVGSCGGVQLVHAHTCSSEGKTNTTSSFFSVCFVGRVVVEERVQTKQGEVCSATAREMQRRTSSVHADTLTRILACVYGPDSISSARCRKPLAAATLAGVCFFLF